MTRARGRRAPESGQIFALARACGQGHLRDGAERHGRGLYGLLRLSNVCSRQGDLRGAATAMILVGESHLCREDDCPTPPFGPARLSGFYLARCHAERGRGNEAGIIMAPQPACCSTGRDRWMGFGLTQMPSSQSTELLHYEASSATGGEQAEQQARASVAIRGRAPHA